MNQITFSELKSEYDARKLQKEIERASEEVLRAFSEVFQDNDCSNVERMIPGTSRVMGTKVLTPLQETCVSMKAIGYSCHEIAKRLGISSNSVWSTHLKDARRKMEAKDNCHLVAKWISAEVLRRVSK